MTNDVFISHSKDDMEQAISVYDALNHKFKCWIYKNDLHSGTIYPDVIGNALLNSKILVLIYTSKTSKSTNVMNELAMAIRAKIPIISFRLENTEYSPGLQTLITTTQYIKAYPGHIYTYIPGLINDIDLLLKELGQTPSPKIPQKNICLACDGNGEDNADLVKLDNMRSAVDNFNLYKFNDDTIRNDLLEISSSFGRYNKGSWFSDKIDYYIKNDLNDVKITEDRILLHLLRADYYHIVDRYEDSYNEYIKAKEIADNNRINLDELLVYTQISYGHILLHLNDLNGAINSFEKDLKIHKNPVLRARDLFRLGEVRVFRGDTEKSNDYEKAKREFTESIEICKGIKKDNKDYYIEARHILADSYRKIGTVSRLTDDLTEALEYYKTSEEINEQHEFRGLIWLQHGYAELYRAQAYKKVELGENNKALELYAKALKQYDRAYEMSREINNTNREAHAMLGKSEVLRLSLMMDMPRDEYRKARDIYERIDSIWGILNCDIGVALSNIKLNREINQNEIEFLKQKSINFGFHREGELLDKVINDEATGKELHPLSLF